MVLTRNQEISRKLQTGKETLTGAPATASARIPPEATFGDKEYLSGTTAGFPNLLEIGSSLVGAFEELRFLADTEIDYVWKKKGSLKQGRPVLAELKKVAGLTSYATEAEYFVVVHASNVWSLTNRQLEAAIYHQLHHLVWDDENENVRGRGHDVEMFRGEVERYGLWTTELHEAKETFAQIPLPVGTTTTVVWGSIRDDGFDTAGEPSAADDE